MDWRDEGIVIAARRHGETAAIVEVLTPAHGRHAGVVRGGASRRMAAVLIPGTQVAVAWQARLGAHLGHFTLEPAQSRAGLMADATALAVLNSVCALLRACLPERDPHPDLYAATRALLDGAWPDGAAWGLAYLRWELGLLAGLGFGLDLTACAVTGARHDLAYVSPRTGRAVARGAAGEWADRLLPLPACLLGAAEADAAGLAQGLAITGHFLARETGEAAGLRPLPEARARLVERLARPIR
ncbi:MAG: DNA repair protein RecO [Rhodobacterales bacterium]|nr:DNA repair protein RecO [Rhodobacterales bacterium]